jgi:hypothetical protein
VPPYECEHRCDSSNCSLLRQPAIPVQCTRSASSIDAFNFFRVSRSSSFGCAFNAHIHICSQVHTHTHTRTHTHTHTRAHTHTHAHTHTRTHTHTSLHAIAHTLAFVLACTHAPGTSSRSSCATLEGLRLESSERSTESESSTISCAFRFFLEMIFCPTSHQPILTKVDLAAHSKCKH